MRRLISWSIWPIRSSRAARSGWKKPTRVWAADPEAAVVAEVAGTKAVTAIQISLLAVAADREADPVIPAMCGLIPTVIMPSKAKGADDNIYLTYLCIPEIWLVSGIPVYKQMNNNN